MYIAQLGWTTMMNVCWSFLQSFFFSLQLFNFIVKSIFFRLHSTHLIHFGAFKSFLSTLMRKFTYQYVQTEFLSSKRVCIISFLFIQFE